MKQYGRVVLHEEYQAKGIYRDLHGVTKYLATYQGSRGSNASCNLHLRHSHITYMDDILPE